MRGECGGRNKEGTVWPTCSAWPIKAKPLCPFFFSGTSSRVSPSSRPRTDLSSSRPFLSVPTFVPVSLFLVPTYNLSLSPPIEKITTPEMLVSSRLRASFRQRLSSQRFRFLPMLSLSPFLFTLFLVFARMCFSPNHSTRI